MIRAAAERDAVRGSRGNDWRDLRELLFAQAPDFDVDHARGWLERILDAGDERLARFEALFADEG